MRIATWAALGLLLTVVIRPLTAGTPKPAACEPGFQWVEEDSFTEVVRFQCKVVPDVKKVKKINYSTKDDPFCVRKGLSCGDCEKCLTCQGPHCRKILVKTEVTCEEPTTKCVVEKIVELVPCKVWKKVPCTTTTTLPAPAAAKK